MAAILSLSVQGGILHAQLSSSAGDVEHRCPLEGIERLLSRAGSDRPGAAVAAGQQLGRALFDGPLASPLREALEGGVLGIKAEGELIAWPWELLWDPQSRRSPVLDGVELVRLVEGKQPAKDYPAAGALVVPQAKGRARLEALQAATRSLSRKLEIEIQALEEGSAPGLSRALSLGQLVAHLEPMIEGGRLKLNEGSSPVEALGLGERTYLSVLGGVDAGLSGARRLREAGVSLILSRQFNLRPNEGGIVDREVYRALAQGASLIEAMRRARRALLRVGKDRPVWAAPVLIASSLEAAVQAFPPPTVSPSHVNSHPSPPATGQEGPLGLPIAASAFIYETIAALQSGQRVNEQGLKARTQAMRRLGGGSATPPPMDKGLPAQARAQQLSAHFIDQIERPDLPLNVPEDLEQRCLQIARRAGLDFNAVRKAALALISSPMVFLKGQPGAGRTRLLRALATGLFGYYPSFTHAHGAALLRGPSPEDQDPYCSGGPLYRAVAMNWSQEGLRPFDPAQPAPTRRAHTFALDSQGAWQSFLGRWLIINGAHLITDDALCCLIGAVRSGVLQGMSGESPYQVPLSADFRVILIGEGMDMERLSGFPVIELSGEEEERGFLEEAERRFGPPVDAAEAKARAARAQIVAELLSAGRAVTTLPSTLGLGAALFAIQFQGDEAEALELTLEMFLEPWRRAQREEVAEALEAVWSHFV